MASTKPLDASTLSSAARAEGRSAHGLSVLVEASVLVGGETYPGWRLTAP